MNLIEKIDKLKDYIFWCKNQGLSIGFVPTMGALHEGHLSLVNQAVAENDVVIVSIFVNPTQFNNTEDLEKYPRTLEHDRILLEKTGCTQLFAPLVEEIYSPDFTPRTVHLGKLDDTLEGHFRPGHFAGVVAVVQRLFDLAQPNKAYFGRKDFQQVAVIKTMVTQLNYPIEIVVGDTIREDNGLAMSSRNARLNNMEKKKAVWISTVLFQLRELAKSSSPEQCKRFGIHAFDASDLNLEYLEIIHPLTFDLLSDKWVPGATACIVAYCGGVRLIDNLELIKS